MPSEEKDEGLVLRSIDYKDRQKIITLFTPSRGLISLIVKNINRTKSHLLTLTSPFTHGEYHFRVSRSDLYTFQDGTPLNTHNNIRLNLAHISAATDLAKALLSSQLQGKPAPDLYTLTLTYLRHLPTFQDPLPLTTSYLLKLLKHEGHLAIDHKPPTFTTPEWTTLLTLTNTRSIQELKATPVSETLHRKTQNLFKEKI